MSGAVAIFAKTPGLTPAKTRLAAEIGQDEAERFYVLSLEAVEAAVHRFVRPRADWIARWAVAEEAGVAHPRWARFGARHTGPGALGERMWRVYEAFRRVHGKVLLIGADAPQITRAHLDAAAKALVEAEFVFGPAADGGFWLFGGRRVVPKETWRGHRYGTEHALADFRTAMAEAGLSEPACLDTLTDVDRRADLPAVAAEMPERRTAEQRRLLAWLEVQARLTGRR